MSLTTIAHVKETATRLKALIADLATATTDALTETNARIIDIAYDADEEMLMFEAGSAVTAEYDSTSETISITTVLTDSEETGTAPARMAGQRSLLE